MTWDGMEWDPFFDCVFAEIPQSKTSKVKEIALVAGADRQSCFFVDLGDYLVLKKHKCLQPRGGRSALGHSTAANDEQARGSHW
eukprot:scaffold105411_cov33-Tisochrysis_lutea.AAC.1